MLRIRLSLKSLFSFDAMGGPTCTNKESGNSTSATAMRRFPCMLLSETCWYVAVRVTIEEVGAILFKGYRYTLNTGGVCLPPKSIYANLKAVCSVVTPLGSES